MILSIAYPFIHSFIHPSIHPFLPPLSLHHLLSIHLFASIHPFMPPFIIILSIFPSFCIHLPFTFPSSSIIYPSFCIHLSIHFSICLSSILTRYLYLNDGCPYGVGRYIKLYTTQPPFTHPTFMIWFWFLRKHIHH